MRKKPFQYTKHNLGSDGNLKFQSRYVTSGFKLFSVLKYFCHQHKSSKRQHQVNPRLMLKRWYVWVHLPPVRDSFIQSVSGIKHKQSRGNKHNSKSSKRALKKKKNKQAKWSKKSFHSTKRFIHLWVVSNISQRQKGR